MFWDISISCGLCFEPPDPNPNPNPHSYKDEDDEYGWIQRILDNDILRIRAGYGSMFAAA